MGKRFDTTDFWGRADYPLMDKIFQAFPYYGEQIALLGGAVAQARTVVDLCTGFGNLAKILAEQGKIVYGVDILPKSLEYIRSKVGACENLFLIQGDARQLGLNQRFDAATCVSTVMSEGLDEFVGEAYRILRPGGVFAVTGYDGRVFPKMLRRLHTSVARKMEQGALTLDDHERHMLIGLMWRMDQGGLPDSKDVKGAFKEKRFEITDEKAFFDGGLYFLAGRKNP